MRILLVDDFEPWRMAASRILRPTPEFQIVGEASDGVEAIEKAAALLPDVVLLDIGLPVLNGLEAARQIRQASPQSKIIFLTGQDDEDLRSAAFATGAEGYVVKARAARELQLTLDTALHRAPDSSDTVRWPAPSLSTP